MGKKDKNKKKLSGTVKTAIKTEKKLNAKQKKELAALGEVRFTSEHLIKTNLDIKTIIYCYL